MHGHTQSGAFERQNTGLLQTVSNLNAELNTPYIESIEQEPADLANPLRMRQMSFQC